jgi:hypothetical protein
MTPAAAIRFGVFLYVALVLLMKWSERRYRNERNFRRAVGEALARKPSADRLGLMN